MIRSILRCSLPGRVLTRHSTAFQRRYYRGEAGDAAPNLSLQEERLLRVAAPKAASIRVQHESLPDLDMIPPSSLSRTAGSSAVDDLRRKRLLYRSKQRGWLEVDLLLGTWASENLNRLTTAELDEYERFVNLETIDIYNIITLRVPVPPELLRQSLSSDGDNHNTSLAEQIQEWARNSPLGKADPEKYKEMKDKHQLI
jgi:succinate dehydrogenase assembly factor 2